MFVIVQKTFWSAYINSGGWGARGLESPITGQIGHLLSICRSTGSQHWSGPFGANWRPFLAMSDYWRLDRMKMIWFWLTRPAGNMQYLTLYLANIGYQFGSLFPTFYDLYSSHQLSELEGLFARNKYPDVAGRADMSRAIGLAEQCIRVVYCKKWRSIMGTVKSKV